MENFNQVSLIITTENCEVLVYNLEIVAPFWKEACKHVLDLVEEYTAEFGESEYLSIAIVGIQDVNENGDVLYGTECHVMGD